MCRRSACGKGNMRMDTAFLLMFGKEIDPSKSMLSHIEDFLHASANVFNISLYPELRCAFCLAAAFPSFISMENVQIHFAFIFHLNGARHRRYMVRVFFSFPLVVIVFPLLSITSFTNLPTFISLRSCQSMLDMLSTFIGILIARLHSSFHGGWVGPREWYHIVANSLKHFNFRETFFLCLLWIHVSVFELNLSNHRWLVNWWDLIKDSGLFYINYKFFFQIFMLWKDYDVLF